MADGVKVAITSFWTLVNNWKSEKNSELLLKSENGRLSVSFSADLGVWVAPSHPTRKSPPSDVRRGHQGPGRGVGPSRQRRRERRAAARAAEATLSDTSEEVVETEDATSATLEKAEEANNANKADPVRKGRTCTKCGGPSKGHPGQCGQKCSVVLKTPEKERHTSFPGDLSLTLTPGQGSREEQCVNCDADMSPNHQCETSQEKILSDRKEDELVIFKLLDSGYAETKLLAVGETPPERVIHPTLGVGTKPRQTEFQDNVWIEYIFETSNVQMEMFKFH